MLCIVINHYPLSAAGPHRYTFPIECIPKVLSQGVLKIVRETGEPEVAEDGQVIAEAPTKVVAIFRGEYAVTVEDVQE